MAGPGRAAFRIPSFLGVFIQLPAVIALVSLFLGESIRFLYGYDDQFLGVWMAAALAPAAVLDGLTLAGRVVWVDDLPSAGRIEAPPPSALALPAAEDAGGLRPAAMPAVRRVLRRPADGVLSVAGAAQLAACIVLMVVQQDSFDSVLGVKLGGIRFYGEYWNRWWFVFYGLMASGAVTLTAALGLFIRRLNRGVE